MTYSGTLFPHPDTKPCVIALHCSLGSGRQWTRLAADLGDDYQVIAPDLSGYGTHSAGPHFPMTLAEEVASLTDQIDHATGPIHLVGHSYGGAVAFKVATASPYASRIRSLTLIEPVLPTLLLESVADRRLHDLFADLAHRVYADLWNGMYLEALDKFLLFWQGSGPGETLSGELRLRMIEHIEKIAFDFTAILGEQGVAAAATSLRVPTLLYSGGLSPYLTQRIVGRLASLIAGAEPKHLPSAGHMLPISHAKMINPDIVGHIIRADDLARVSLAAPPEAIGESWTRDQKLRPVLR